MQPLFFFWVVRLSLALDLVPVVSLRIPSVSLRFPSQHSEAILGLLLEPACRPHKTALVTSFWGAVALQT